MSCTVVGRVVDSGIKLPLFLSRISAGPLLPVEADVYDLVGLTEMLGLTGESYLVKAEGDSMRDVGIHPGGTLVVAVGEEARDGNVVIAIVGGEMTVKRVCREGRQLYLVPGNEAYDRVPVEDDLDVWGVVTAVVHDLRLRR